MSKENQWLIWSTSITVTMAISASVLAENANFGTLTLPGQPPSVSGVLTGSTGGSYSLSSLAKRDVQDRPCLGFATSTPDHILVLQQDFAQVSMQVNSRGRDTTLLVQSSHPTQFFCGDDTGSSKDASLTGVRLKAGTYRIWVGSLDEGNKVNYSLSIQVK